MYSSRESTTDRCPVAEDSLQIIADFDKILTKNISEYVRLQQNEGRM